MQKQLRGEKACESAGVERPLPCRCGAAPYSSVTGWRARRNKGFRHGGQSLRWHSPPSSDTHMRACTHAHTVTLLCTSHGLNCRPCVAPNSHVGVLTPHTSDYDLIWEKGHHRGNELRGGHVGVGLSL